MNIVINGRAQQVDATTLTFADVVRLASAPLQASVTYRRAAGPKTEGCLTLGGVVEIQEGTIFNAYVTGNA
jgi:hypothetical protein